MTETLFRWGRYEIIFNWGAMLHDLRADFTFLEDFWYTMTTVLLWCAVALISTLAVHALVTSAVSAWKGQRAKGASYASLVFFVLASVATVYCAANKPPPIVSATLRFDKGLHDSGSVATNDYPFIRAIVDQPYRLDTIHIDYRDKGSTNAMDYVRAYDGSTADLAAGIRLFIPNCTNRLIWIWSEYIPPPPDHTNGEYRIDYVSRPIDEIYDPANPRFIMLRTPVTDAETGRKMSPPELPDPIEFTDDEIRRLLNDTPQENNQ